MPLIQLANPTRFLILSGRLLPFAWAGAAVLTAAGLYYAFPGSPPEEEMGETVRMMYVHVPAVWLSMAVYALMAIAALGTLVWRHPLADVASRAAAPIGAAFTFLGLVTGSLWGRPTWGTFWVWDGRLTSYLVLLLIYLGIVAVWRTVEDSGRAGRVAAILTLVGAVNLPIIFFSVSWWNTLHQPPSIITEGDIAPSFLPPLFLMLGAYTFLLIGLMLTRMRTEILGRRARSLQLQAAGAGG